MSNDKYIVQSNLLEAKSRLNAVLNCSGLDISDNTRIKIKHAILYLEEAQNEKT